MVEKFPEAMELEGITIHPESRKNLEEQENEAFPGSKPNNNNSPLQK